MNVRYFNGTVITMNDNNDIFCGEVHTCDDKIVYVGKDSPKTCDFDREVDLKGGVIMPGFKNCHTHSPMALFRNYADDLPLDKWLFEKIFPLEDQLTGEAVYWGTLLSVIEYLAGGVTSVCDMYFFDEWVMKAMIDGGMRCVFVKALTDANKDTNKILADFESVYNKYNNLSPLIRYDLGLHAEYTASRNLLKGAGELSKKLNAPITTHLSESKKEVKECFEKTGYRPVEEMIRHGVFDLGGMADHCVQVNEEEIQMLKNKNVSVVTNPASNLKLGNGVAPITQMLKNGLNVAIGTDGPASNNSLNMFREMYLTCVLQKGIVGDPTVLPAEVALQMATKNGAVAMRIPECDCLAEGKQADLVVLDLNKPNTQPIANVVNTIVYSADNSNVRMTVIAGNILYEEGKFNIKVDVEEVYKHCNELISGFKK